MKMMINRGVLQLHVDSKPFSGLGILHIPKVLSLAEASIQRQI
jgi:hypothetical protein